MAEPTFLAASIITGYAAMMGVTYATLNHVWPPVEAVSEYAMDVLKAKFKNDDRETVRFVGAALWPITFLWLCLAGVATYSSKLTSWLLNARKPRAKLPEARTVTHD